MATNQNTQMQQKYHHAHKMVSFHHDDATIRGIHYAPIGEVSIEDLSATTGYSEVLIATMAGPDNVQAISWSSISNSPKKQGTGNFIPVTTAVNILRSCSGHTETAAALEIWAHQELTGNHALIATGMTVGARHIHEVLGIREDFYVWAREVGKRHPVETFETGFQEKISREGDFPVPLNLAQLLAKEVGHFIGLVLATAVSRCGFYHRSYLYEPFIDTLDDFRFVLPSLNNGLVDARQARRILNEGLALDLWLNALTEYFPMRWNIDYFSKTPIPEWNWDMQTPPPPINGPIWFTASLIEEIAAEPVYDIEYSDFAAHLKLMEGCRPLFAHLEAIKLASAHDGASNSQPID